MAEEKEGTPNEPENTPESDSQPEGTPPEPKDAETNWEQRYKDLQADYTRTSQRLADAEQQAPEPPPEEPEDDGDGGEFVDKKTVKQMVDSAVSDAVKTVRMQSANTYFRKSYPELVKYESAVAGIMRSPKDAAKLKGASPEERIDAAVKEFNEMTEEAKATAKTEAEAAAKEREEKNRKAAGLGGTITPPPKGDEEDKSDAQELADRKAQSAKRRGLA